jgi:outer membrane protein OmpA-like peptidoglycan-associated protein
MANLHYGGHAEDEESYFASMTDVVIGLLFVFIIMLMFFAMRFQEATQKQDAVTEKQNALIEDLTDAEVARSNILESIGTHLRKEGINVIVVKDEGILRLPEEILFERSSWELKKAGASNALRSLANALDLVLPCYTAGSRSTQEKCPKTKAKVEAIFIEGHADSDAFHPNPPAPPPQRRPGGIPTQPDNLPAQTDSRSPLSQFLSPATPQDDQRRAPSISVARQAFPPKDNLDLSALRATSTFRELLSARQELSQYLSPNNKQVLSVSGYGEYRPLPKEPNENLERWKQRNRRIDIRILMVTPKSADAKQMQQDIDRTAIRP